MLPQLSSAVDELSTEGTCCAEIHSPIKMGRHFADEIIHEKDCLVAYARLIM